MNRDEILELITTHTISSRIEEGTDLIHEIYVNDFVDNLLEAIQVIHCCKSDSKLLHTKVFILANELAKAGYGNEAVRMHHICNGM